MNLAIAALLAGAPAAAGERAGAEDVIPGIGLGDIDRVPCGLTDAQTPGPSVGSLHELAKLCPGALSVQLRLARARLLRRRAIWLVSPVWRVRIVGQGGMHGHPHLRAGNKMESRYRPE
jgi:hypothetical protein